MEISKVALGISSITMMIWKKGRQRICEEEEEGVAQEGAGGNGLDRVASSQQH